MMNINEQELKDICEAQARRMDKAKFQMMHDHDFYAFMILTTEFEESFEVPTMGTDGVKIWYNPTWTQSINDAECKGVLKHEGKHITHKHHIRGPHHYSPQDIDKMDEKQKQEVMLKHKKWNMACDYAINLELKDEGETLPGQHLYDTKYKGMTAEAIYRSLKDEDVQCQTCKGSGELDKKGQPAEAGKGDQPCPDCGGGGTQVVAIPGEVFKKGGKPMSKAEQQKEEIKVDAKIINAAAQAKKAGRLPAGMDRFVEGLTRTDVDYRELLRYYVEKAMCRNDYDWRMPNKRYACQQGVYLPALWGEEVKNIFVFMDTSGSIGQKELDILAGNVATIISTFNAEVTVAYIDTKVHNVETFTQQDLVNDKLKLKPQGGGGTRFSPAFEWIKDNDKRPQVVLYMTDLQCSDYGDKPEYPVIWLFLQSSWSSGNEKSRVPWGQVVDIDMRNV
jgi:predicted metal-dependent peptidase